MDHPIVQHFTITILFGIVIAGMEIFSLEEADIKMHHIGPDLQVIIIVMELCI
jgi:hypothetical protein